MRKKISSESSRPENLIRVSSADIFGKPLSAEQAARLDALARMPDSEIDYSDVPVLTEEQLTNLPARS